jgi:hypothetical protein
VNYSTGSSSIASSKSPHHQSQESSLKAQSSKGFQGSSGDDEAVPGLNDTTSEISFVLERKESGQG